MHYGLERGQVAKVFFCDWNRYNTTRLNPICHDDWKEKFEIYDLEVKLKIGAAHLWLLTLG